MTEITIKIDLEKIKSELEAAAVDKVVRIYFNADDIGDYRERENIQKKRLNEIIGQVDWNKLPEEMQRGILRKFVERFITNR